MYTDTLYLNIYGMFVCAPLHLFSIEYTFSNFWTNSLQKQLLAPPTRQQSMLTYLPHSFQKIVSLYLVAWKLEYKCVRENAAHSVMLAGYFSQHFLFSSTIAKSGGRRIIVMKWMNEWEGVCVCASSMTFLQTGKRKINVKVEFKAFLSECVQAVWLADIA